MEIEVHNDLNESILSEWHRFLGQSRHQHPRQDPRFAEVEQANGNTPLYVLGFQKGELCALGIFSLCPSGILPGRYATATALSGPVCDDTRTMISFLSALSMHSAFAKVGALLITPYWLGDEALELSRTLAQAGWRVSGAEPFRQTGLVNLKPEPSAILANFSKSARREVRRAERQGVEVHFVREEASATEFLDSLNHLRQNRNLSILSKNSFMVSFMNIYRSGDIGALLAAYHCRKFIGGLLLHRSRLTAHTPHFTTEVGQLRLLGNLRLAPLLWFEGMKWAKQQGCETLDVEGWQQSPDLTDKKYNIYKYKGEYNPIPVQRISDHVMPLNRFIHETEQVFPKTKRVAKILLRLARS